MSIGTTDDSDDDDDDARPDHVSGLQHTGDEGFEITSMLPVSNRLGNAFTTSMKLNKPADKLHIAVWATTYDGRPVFRLGGAVGGKNESLRLALRTDHWIQKEERERLKTAAVTHIRANYEAVKEGKLVAADSRVMMLQMPKVNMLCGKKKVNLGDKITCTISFYNPLPWKITATLDVTVSGNTKHNFAPQTIHIGPKLSGVDRKSYWGRFDSVPVPPPTTNGTAIIIASVKSPYLNAVRGVYEIVVADPTDHNHQHPLNPHHHPTSTD